MHRLNVRLHLKHVKLRKCYDCMQDFSNMDLGLQLSAFTSSAGMQNH